VPKKGDAYSRTGKRCKWFRLSGGNGGNGHRRCARKGYRLRRSYSSDIASLGGEGSCEGEVTKEGGRVGERLGVFGGRGDR